MRDQYLSASQDLVDEVIDRHNLQVSSKLQSHAVLVMANYFDKSLKDISITVEYLRRNINEPNSLAYSELGDHCLMFTSLFKGRAKKLGSVPYYSKIGATSYMYAYMTEEAYGFKYMRDILNLVFKRNMHNDIDELLDEASADSPFAKEQLKVINVVKGPWYI